MKKFLLISILLTVPIMAQLPSYSYFDGYIINNDKYPNNPSSCIVSSSSPLVITIYADRTIIGNFELRQVKSYYYNGVDLMIYASLDTKSVLKVFVGSDGIFEMLITYLSGTRIIFFNYNGLRKYRDEFLYLNDLPLL